MSSVSILGLGTYARAIGTRAIEGGATAGTFGTAPAGDIVVLAVPYASAVPVVAQYGDASSPAPARVDAGTSAMKRTRRIVHSANTVPGLARTTAPSS